MTRFTVVSNPENRRVEFFRSAARSRGHDCRVIAWATVLEQGVPDLTDTVVRLDSFGENWEVERRLIAKGRRARGVSPDGRDAAEDHGRIRGIGDAYRGFADLLARFPDDAHYLNPPDALLPMFDKVATKRRLRDAGLTVAKTYGRVHTFDELVAALDDAAASRAFVKPRHGSSASGVIALARRPDRISATTSIELEADRLYNSLRIRRYDRLDDVRAIVDLLGREDELLVEEWVPKASGQGGAFDLRIVCIDGECDHAVMRVSRSPMTNLHLGNDRGDLDALRERLGAERWSQVVDAARRSAAAFDGALYAGVDVGITTGLRHVVVFEVNAFGDLLPGIVDAAGRTTYEAQIDAL